MLNSGVEYSLNNEIQKQTEVTQKNGAFLLYAELTQEANKPDTNVAVYFDVLTSHDIQINDNITDNWLENMTVVNDCIAQQPIEITLSGVSSELVYTPSTNKGWLKSLYTKLNDDTLSKFSNEYVITDKLTVIPELFPPLDNITQTAKNLVTTVENNVKRYTKILNNFRKSKDERNNTRLQEIYNSLVELRNDCKISGEGLTVQTPYATFNNMFIKSIKLTQENKNHVSDISVTLKQVKFSEIEYSAADQNVLSEFNMAARQTEENHGKVQGVNKDSILYSWLQNKPEYTNYKN